MALSMKEPSLLVLGIPRHCTEMPNPNPLLLVGSQSLKPVCSKGQHGLIHS
jgi:hypothetical protein